jgi:hypothetical protein
MNTEIETPPQVPIYYVPTIASTTRIAKVLLMINIISNAFCVLYGFVLLIHLMATSKSGTPASIAFLLLAWWVCWLVLSIKGYNSINHLRQECLSAKGVVCQ